MFLIFFSHGGLDKRVFIVNYDKYFTIGSHEVEQVEEYHSHNTARLDVEGMKELLLKLNFIREDLGLQARAKAKDIRSE